MNFSLKRDALRSIGLCLSILSIGLRVFSQSDSAYLPFTVKSDTALNVIQAWEGRSFSVRDFEQVTSDIKSALLGNGFLAFEVLRDTVNDSLILSYSPGLQYQWALISTDEANEEILRRSGVKLKRFGDKPISPEQLENSRDLVIRYLEKNGYPFASVSLDSLRFVNENLHARLAINKGPLITVDSVVVKGDLKLRETYLTNYLGISEGDFYNEKRIRQISSALEEVGFLSEIKPAEVLFNKENTKLYLYLRKKNSSRFDGIVGFLPDNNTGELLITGDVKLRLENALKQGEIIDVNWRKLQTNTQELNAEVIAPFVLNSPFSVDGRLILYRRDTLFSDVSRQLGFRYQISRTNYIRLFVDRQTTNLISTKQYENTVLIPPYLDRSITAYGLALDLKRLNDRLNPSKGYETFIEGSAGTKVIVENARLPEFIYDSLELRTLQIKARAKAAYYFEILPRLVWHQRYLLASIVNDQLFNNEAFRIGGLLTLRGFDEESIFATSYAIGRTEIRYQLDREGYVFGFFDAAYYENNSLNAIVVQNDIPYGFGAGVSFGTRAGIFSLTYALGSQQGNPILIRAGKIHFGFITIF